MSRRPLAAFAVGAVLMASLTACSTSDSTAETASTPEACDLNDLALVEDGTLTIGTDKPWPSSSTSNKPSTCSRSPSTYSLSSRCPSCTSCSGCPSSPRTRRSPSSPRTRRSPSSTGKRSTQCC